MTKALLALHVIAAILAVGPVAVAASMFPAAARRAAAEPEQRSHLTVLHRICNVYAVLAVAVPVFGCATAATLHVLGSAWLVAAMALTAAAAFVLAAVILPGQRRMLAAPGDADDPAGNPADDPALRGRLAASAGVFNLLWAAVTVLMILRPGSTTGA
jgi:hypothetical protein